MTTVLVLYRADGANVMPSYVPYDDLDDLCIHSLRQIRYTFTNRGTSWTWRWNEVQRMASREPVGLHNGVWNAPTPDECGNGHSRNRSVRASSTSSSAWSGNLKSASYEIPTVHVKATKMQMRCVQYPTSLNQFQLVPPESCPLLPPLPAASSSPD